MVSANNIAFHNRGSTSFCPSRLRTQISLTLFTSSEKLWQAPLNRATEGHATQDFKKQPPCYKLLLVPLRYTSSIKPVLLHYCYFITGGKKCLLLINTEFFFTNGPYIKLFLYIKPRQKQTTNNGLYASGF